MAINPETEFVGKINPSDAEYPYGKARDITNPGDGTGTNWKANYINDDFGWKQALLQKAGLTPSGSPDTALESQYLQAMDINHGLSVADYSALIALDPADLVDGQVVNITDAGIAGSGNIRKVAGHGFTSISGVIIRIDDDTYWERDYSGIPSVKWWGAVADGVTDISSEINLALTEADSLLFPDDDSEYFITAGNLNAITGKMLVGQSKEGTKLRFSTAQLDCITSAGNTYLANMTINGGWDGVTPAQLGDLIRVDSPSFISQVTLKNLKLLNAKQDSVRLSNLGYSSIEDVQSNVTGRIGLHLDGESAKTNTTIKLSGRNVFSDCPNGFGVRVYDGHNCDLGKVICEYTAGIEIAGNNNRALNFDGVYQEFGSGSNAYTFTGSGVGLTITNNFGGGQVIPNTGNFSEVTIFGNSNFSSIAPIQSNDLIVTDSSQASTPATTGQTSITLLSTASPVPAGLYRVVAIVQTEDAGSSSLNSLSAYVTTSASDSAYQNGTTSLTKLTDSKFGTVSPSSRLQIDGYLSLSSATTIYLRFGYDQSAGQIAYIGSLTLERVK